MGLGFRVSGYCRFPNNATRFAVHHFPSRGKRRPRLWGKHPKVCLAGVPVFCQVGLVYRSCRPSRREQYRREGAHKYTSFASSCTSRNTTTLFARTNFRISMPSVIALWPPGCCTSFASLPASILSTTSPPTMSSSRGSEGTRETNRGRPQDVTRPTSHANSITPVVWADKSS